MRLLLPVLLLAACADPGAAVEERLLARRAALGLPPDPLSFDDAMRALQEAHYEGLLGRAGSKRLPADELLDAALRIENLLARADPATAETRARDPEGFDARQRAARERALALARAVGGGGGGQAEAGELLTSCLDCHHDFRKPR